MHGGDDDDDDDGFGDDSATRRRVDLSATRAAVVPRFEPEIRWTDARGAHSFRLVDRATVGSAPGVDLAIPDRTVSRVHAEFEHRPDGVWIRDLGSTNGTYVGGLMVTAARVPEGVAITLGDVTLGVRYDTQPRPRDLWPADHFGPLVGPSLVMRELFARLARVAAQPSTVLIQGETGTGKELVARALHEASPRADAPYVVVDCAALPEGLLESELFGHTRGAFTGATDARAGAIEAARGGTVLLDEVGELPLAMQPKLLRVLESRTVRRVGESQHRGIDVRFLSATRRDLRQMVNAGAFREDLYFRLAVVPVTVPPLRARRDDVPALAAHIASALGVPNPLGRAVLDGLANHPWNGNVRELRNLIECAAALGLEHALALLRGEEPASAAPDASARAAAEPATALGAGAGQLPAALLDLPFREAREQWLAVFEREYVEGLLARSNGNVPAAARAAGLDRTYIYRLLQKRRG